MSRVIDKSALALPQMKKEIAVKLQGFVETFEELAIEETPVKTGHWRADTTHAPRGPALKYQLKTPNTKYSAFQMLGTVKNKANPAWHRAFKRTENATGMKLEQKQGGYGNQA